MSHPTANNNKALLSSNSQLYDQIYDLYREDLQSYEHEIACLERKLSIAQKLHAAELNHWKNKVTINRQQIEILREDVKYYKNQCMELSDYYSHFHYQKTMSNWKKTASHVSRVNSHLFKSMHQRSEVISQMKSKMIEKSIASLHSGSNSSSSNEHVTTIAESNGTMGHEHEKRRGLNDSDERVRLLELQLAETVQELNMTRHMLNEEKRKSSTRFSSGIDSPMFSPSPIKHTKDDMPLDSPMTANAFHKLLSQYSAIDQRQSKPHSDVVQPQIRQEAERKERKDKESLARNDEHGSVKKKERVDPVSPQSSSLGPTNSVNAAVRKQLHFEAGTTTSGSSSEQEKNPFQSPTDITPSVVTDSPITSSGTKRPRSTSESNIISSTKKKKVSINDSQVPLSQSMAAKSDSTLSELIKGSPLGLPAHLNSKAKAIGMKRVVNNLLFSSTVPIVKKKDKD